MNRPRTPRFLIPFMLAVLAIFALAAPTAALAREADVGEYFYTQLSEQEKEIYDQLLEQADKLTDDHDPGNVVVSLDEPRGSDLNLARVNFAFFRDHPEYFWVYSSRLGFEQTANYTDAAPEWNLSASSGESYFYEGFDSSNLQDWRTRFDAKVAEIIAGIPESADALATIQYLNNWMALNNVYNELGRGATNLSRCAASGILSDNGQEYAPVCYGYATALKVLLDRAGIQNVMVTGNAYNDRNLPYGELHAWNYVTLDDGATWYALDPTWDDPSVPGRPATGTYFMVGSETVTITNPPAGMDHLIKFGANHVAGSSSSMYNLSYPALSTERYEGTSSLVVEVVLPNGTSQNVSTLKDALEIAAQNRGTTIRLWTQVAATETLTIPDGTTIDLNGIGTNSFTSPAIGVSCEGSALSIEVGSSVSIINSGSTFSMIRHNGTTGAVIQNNGSLTLGAGVQLSNQGVSHAVGGSNEAVADLYAYLSAPSRSQSCNKVIAPVSDEAAESVTSGTTVKHLLDTAAINDGQTSYGDKVALTYYNGTQNVTPTDAVQPALEWRLEGAPAGAGTDAASALVPGRYTLRVVVAGTDSFYGYDVFRYVDVVVDGKTEADVYLEKLDAELGRYQESAYFAEDWSAIKQAYDTAKEAMSGEGATTEQMQAALDVFMATASGIQVRDAFVQEALSKLDEAFTVYNEADYTPEGWQQLTAAYEKGKEAVVAAQTHGDLDAAFETATGSMAQVAQRDVVVADAMARLAAAFNTYSEDDYLAEDWAAIASAYDAAEAAIKAADASEAAMDDAIADFSAAAAAVELREHVIADALAQLDAAHNGYVQDAYTEEGWRDLTVAYENGKAAISAVTSRADLAAALDNAKAAMDAIEEAPEPPAGPDAQAYLDKLMGEYEKLDADSYLDEDWQQILDALGAAQASIKADGATEEDMQDAIDVFVDASSGIQTRAEAIAEAKADLEAAYEGYDKDDYTDEGWSQLTAAYEDGLAAIDTATAREQLEQAVADAKAAMEAVDKAPVDPEPEPDPSPDPEPSPDPSPNPKPVEDVTVVETVGGTVKVDSVEAGKTATIVATPEAGQEVRDVVVTDAKGNAVEVKVNQDGTYSFEMPEGGVTVDVLFGCNGGDLCQSHGFADVDQSKWYHDAVDWAVKEGVFHGYSPSAFGPDDVLTREQAAAVLYNYLGGESGAAGSGLVDVEGGQWYTDVVNWVVANGIMTGYTNSDDFGVGDALTREQFCAVIAKAMKADLSSVDLVALESFPDADEISGWARPAVAWAVEQGVLNGVENADGTRMLQGVRNITRAEMAAMMKNAVDEGVLQK